MGSRIIGAGLVLGIMGIMGTMGGTACVMETDDWEPDGFREGEAGSGGSDVPSGGGTWLGNGLEHPNVSGISPLHGLATEQGLSSVGVLAEDGGPELVEYLVECALPEGEGITKIVDGQELVFEGHLGLAPEWKDGACDEDCQEWVSACLLARTNVTGQSVQIWITGDHPNLGLGHDLQYPLHEATFFGNLFVDPPLQMFCRGTLAGQDMAYLDGRTCTGDDPEACGFTALGKCQQQQRCVMQGGIPNDCQAGEPAAGQGYRSLSTFVDIPVGWHGWDE